MNYNSFKVVIYKIINLNYQSFTFHSVKGEIYTRLNILRFSILFKRHFEKVYGNAQNFYVNKLYRHL